MFVLAILVIEAIKPFPQIAHQSSMHIRDVRASTAMGMVRGRASLQ